MSSISNPYGYQLQINAEAIKKVSSALSSGQKVDGVADSITAAPYARNLATNVAYKTNYEIGSARTSATASAVSHVRENTQALYTLANTASGMQTGQGPLNTQFATQLSYLTKNIESASHRADSLFGSHTKNLSYVVGRDSTVAADVSIDSTGTPLLAASYAGYTALQTGTANGTPSVTVANTSITLAIIGKATVTAAAGAAGATVVAGRLNTGSTIAITEGYAVVTSTNPTTLVATKYFVPAGTTLTLTLSGTTNTSYSNPATIFDPAVNAGVSNIENSTFSATVATPVSPAAGANDLRISTNVALKAASDFGTLDISTKANADAAKIVLERVLGYLDTIDQKISVTRLLSDTARSTVIAEDKSLAAIVESLTVGNPVEGMMELKERQDRNSIITLLYTNAQQARKEELSTLRRTLSVGGA